VAVLLATLASPFASSFPDGLERVAEDKGFIERASEEVTVWQNSLFPDYTLPIIQAEGLSTSAAGLIGTLLMFAMGYVVVGSMVRQPMKK
jgi:cobalt/nickel transport protein